MDLAGGCGRCAGCQSSVRGRDQGGWVGSGLAVYTWPTTGWPRSTAAPPRRSTRRCRPTSQPAPSTRPLWTLGVSGPDRFPDWPALDAAVPGVAATMRRYLDQLSCLLRPRSVGNADQALRSLAAFLAEQAPAVTAVADINRRHIEDFIRWLAGDHGAPAGHPADVLRAHQRVGLARRANPRADHPQRPSAPRPSAAEGAG